jgi:hypothetical protein
MHRPAARRRTERARKPIPNAVVARKDFNRVLHYLIEEEYLPRHKKSLTLLTGVAVCFVAAEVANGAALGTSGLDPLDASPGILQRHAHHATDCTVD